MKNVVINISIPEHLLQGLIEDEVRKIIRERAETQLNSDRVMDAEEAAEYLHISRTTLWRKCSERNLPHSKNGSKLMFLKSDLDEWVKNGKRKTRIDADIEAANYTMNHPSRFLQ